MLEKLFADVSHEVAALLDGSLSGKELTTDGAARLLMSAPPFACVVASSSLASPDGVHPAPLL